MFRVCIGCTGFLDLGLPLGICWFLLKFEIHSLCYAVLNFTDFLRRYLRGNYFGRLKLFPGFDSVSSQLKEESILAK